MASTSQVSANLNVVKVPAEIYAWSRTQGISNLEYSRYQIEADQLHSILLIKPAQLDDLISEYNNQINLERQWEETQETIHKKAWLTALKQGKVLTVAKPAKCLVL